MFVPFTFISTFMWSGEFCMFHKEDDVRAINQAIESFKVTRKWPESDKTIELQVISNNTLKTVPICDLAKAIYNIDPENKVNKPKQGNNKTEVAIFSIIFLGLCALQFISFV